MSAALKLRWYYEEVLTHVYAEGESPYHRDCTRDVIERFIEPLSLPRHANIIDLGCGVGYFMEEMRERGYNRVTGMTLSPDDLEVCLAKRLNVYQRDMNFLDDETETVDLLFSRHSLEHSPFPYITLLEYNRVLKPNAYLYIEVPQPGNARNHEDNVNHYSIMGRDMWLSLLKRTGFDVSWYDYMLPIKMPDQEEAVEEHYYIFVCKRRRSVDVK